MGIGKLTLTAGYNLNDTKITDRRTFSGFTADRLFARPESLRLTDGQPSNKLNIGLDWESGPAGLTLRGNRYGSVFIPVGSEGDIDVAKGAAPGDLTLSPKWVVDLEFRFRPVDAVRSEEHTSELQSLMRNSYAVFCVKKKTKCNTH